MADFFRFRNPLMNSFDPEEEERRKRMERLAQIEPVTTADVTDAAANGPELPEVDPIETDRSELYGKYTDWQSRMPNREDYKPSFGRKALGAILGAIAGYGNPGQAAAFSDAFTNRKFNQAQEKWQEEGEALGEVRPLATSMMRSATTERGQDIRASTATRGQDVRANTVRRGQDIAASTAAAGRTSREGIAAADRVSREREGAAGRTSREGIAAKGRQTAERIARLRDAGATARNNADIAAGKERAKQPKWVSAREQENYEGLALDDVVREHPEYEDFIDRGPKGDSVPMLKNLDESNKVDWWFDKGHTEEEYDRFTEAFEAALRKRMSVQREQ